MRTEELRARRGHRRRRRRRRWRRAVTLLFFFPERTLIDPNQSNPVGVSTDADARGKVIVVVHYHRDDVGDVRNAIDPSALAVDAGVDDALGVDNHDDDAGVGARSESGDGGVARRFGFF